MMTRLPELSLSMLFPFGRVSLALYAGLLATSQAWQGIQWIADFAALALFL